MENANKTEKYFFDLYKNKMQRSTSSLKSNFGKY